MAGFLLACSRAEIWEKGYSLVQKMMSLNLHHPGWFYFIPFYYHDRKNENEKALIAAKQINMPYYQWTHLLGHRSSLRPASA